MYSRTVAEQVTPEAAEAPAISTEHWIEHARRNLSAYDEPALPDPAHTIHVNPFEITKLARLHIATRHGRDGVAKPPHLPQSKLLDFGTIMAGDWDLHWENKRNPLLIESITFRSVWQRYGLGVPWKKTDVFQARLKAIEETGRTDHQIATRTQLKRRYKRLDEIFDEVRSEGYTPGPIDDSITVSIGRTGECLAATVGKHRLAIAQFLRLPSVEVYVITRHREWQDIRHRASQGLVPSPHPDLMEFAA